MIYDILVGMVIGAGLILPGVSGGILAVILGVYEKIIHSLNGFFKSPKKNLKLLIPIIIGMIIGLLIFGNILKFLFKEYYVESCFAFMGLILGGIPVLIKKAENKGKINGIALLIALILSLSLFVLGNNKIDFSTSLDGSISSIFKLFLTGFLFISGKVVPGISSSFMLMLIGMYEFMLNIISNPIEALSLGFGTLMPLIVGLITGLIIFVKVINYALKKFSCTTYSIIIGFVIGSLPVIYPGIKFDLTGLICIIIFIISFVGSYKLSMLVKKN
jgi:putative membrane protein